MSPISNLENTSWKISKETYYYPNGNSENFVNSSDLNGIFIWSFGTDSSMKIKYEPYTFIVDGNWEKNQNSLIIKTFSPDDSLDVRHYTIIELTETFMKLNVEDVRFQSSNNGNANKHILEFRKQ